MEWLKLKEREQEDDAAHSAAEEDDDGRRRAVLHAADIRAIDVHDAVKPISAKEQEESLFAGFNGER